MNFSNLQDKHDFLPVLLAVAMLVPVVVAAKYYGLDELAKQFMGQHVPLSFVGCGVFGFIVYRALFTKQATRGTR